MDFKEYLNESKDFTDEKLQVGKYVEIFSSDDEQMGWVKIIKLTPKEIITKEQSFDRKTGIETRSKRKGELDKLGQHLIDKKEARTADILY